MVKVGEGVRKGAFADGANRIDQMIRQFLPLGLANTDHWPWADPADEFGIAPSNSRRGP